MTDENVNGEVTNEEFTLIILALGDSTLRDVYSCATASVA